MSKKKTSLIALLIVILISAFFVYRYAYQPHRNIETEVATYNTTAEAIINEFIADPDMATKKYLDQTVSIKGTITAINKNNITVNDKIFARFDKEVTNKEIKNIHFKGRCIGYDDLLEEIRFEQCFLIN